MGKWASYKTYCYIEDCVETIYRLMQSDFHDPFNLGQDRLESINQLADVVAGDSREGDKERA